MICKFCGNVIDDNSDFCFICGQKVSAEVPAYAVATEEKADVFSQPQQASFVASPEAQPIPQPGQPIVQQPAPEYAAQAAPEVNFAAAPQAPVASTTDEKFAKKFKKSKGLNFLGFLFAIIGLIVYRSAKKKGYEERAKSLLNSIMIGLDVKMAIIVVVMIYKFMIAG